MSVAIGPYLSWIHVVHISVKHRAQIGQVDNGQSTKDYIDPKHPQSLQEGTRDK